MKFIKYFTMSLVLIGMILGSFGSVAAAADPSLKYKNVHVWVDPEYDDPRLLVMMQGELDGINPPVTVTFLVPTAAEMYSAGSIDILNNNKYTGGPPNRTASSVPGWDEISFTLTTTTYRVEYYDPIILGLPDKTIAYEFRTPVPITQLTMFVQQPKRATNFKVEPAGQLTQDGEGFNIQTFNYPVVDPPTAEDFYISYTKADNTPSLSSTSGTNTTGTTGSVNSTLLAVLVGVIVIGAIGLFLWSQSKSKKKSRSRRNRTAPAAAKATSPGKAAGKAFCPECGEPVAGTKFCPNCGTKL